MKILSQDDFPLGERKEISEKVTTKIQREMWKEMGVTRNKRFCYTNKIIC